jgi:hypothetical protein
MRNGSTRVTGPHGEGVAGCKHRCSVEGQEGGRDSTPADVRSVDGHDERVPDQDVRLGEGSSIRLCPVYRRDLDRERSKRESRGDATLKRSALCRPHWSHGGRRAHFLVRSSSPSTHAPGYRIVSLVLPWHLIPAPFVEAPFCDTGSPRGALGSGSAGWTRAPQPSRGERPVPSPFELLDGVHPHSDGCGRTRPASGARQGLDSRGTLPPSLTSFRGSVNCRRIGIGLCASTCRCMGITLDRTIRIKGLPPPTRPYPDRLISKPRWTRWSPGSRFGAPSARPVDSGSGATP